MLNIILVSRRGRYYTLIRAEIIMWGNGRHRGCQCSETTVVGHNLEHIFVNMDTRFSHCLGTKNPISLQKK